MADGVIRRWISRKFFENRSPVKKIRGPVDSWYRCRLIACVELTKIRNPLLHSTTDEWKYFCGKREMNIQIGIPPRHSKSGRLCLFRIEIRRRHQLINGGSWFDDCA